MTDATPTADLLSTPAARGHRAPPGEPAAVEAATLLGAHQRQIAGLAHRLLGWPGDVDDVVQDVFVNALENLPKFRGECQLSTWLYRIAINCCRRHRRRSWLRRHVTPFVGERGTDSRVPAAAHASSPVAAALAGETTEDVRAAVRALPATDREVIVLHYIEGLSAAEIGEILRLSPNAVQVRLHRARRRLKSELQLDGGPADG